jgi:hypothetical protein
VFNIFHCAEFTSRNYIYDTAPLARLVGLRELSLPHRGYELVHQSRTCQTVLHESTIAQPQELVLTHQSPCHFNEYVDKSMAIYHKNSIHLTTLVRRYQSYQHLYLKIPSFVHVTSAYHSNHDAYLSLVAITHVLGTVANKNFHRARACQNLTHGKLKRTYAHSPYQR